MISVFDFSDIRVPDVYTEFRKKVEGQSRVRSSIKMPETFKPLPPNVSEGLVPSLEELGIKGIIGILYLHSVIHACRHPFIYSFIHYFI